MCKKTREMESNETGTFIMVLEKEAVCFLNFIKDNLRQNIDVNLYVMEMV
jgi:hypothetical protein